MKPETAGLHEALKCYGTQSALARACGYSRQRVQGWVRRGRVARQCVARVATVTGVPVSRLAPELHWGFASVAKDE